MSNFMVDVTMSNGVVVKMSKKSAEAYAASLAVQSTPPTPATTVAPTVTAPVKAQVTTSTTLEKALKNIFGKMAEYNKEHGKLDSEGNPYSSITTTIPLPFLPSKLESGKTATLYNVLREVGIALPDDSVEAERYVTDKVAWIGVGWMRNAKGVRVMWIRSAKDVKANNGPVVRTVDLKGMLGI